MLTYLSLKGRIISFGIDDEMHVYIEMVFLGWEV